MGGVVQQQRLLNTEYISAQTPPPLLRDKRLQLFSAELPLHHDEDDEQVKSRAGTDMSFITLRMNGELQVTEVMEGGRIRIRPFT